ncbi:protein kinase [bacterium]|nr:protein kinase [bacterium]
MTDTKSAVQRMMINSPCSTKMNKFKNVRVIGKGEHGTVYHACLNDACKMKFAVKVSTENLTAEHNLTKKFINMVGKNTAADVYTLEKCKNDTRLYSEFLEGQPFGKLLPKLNKDPRKIRSIVIQVLKILKTLHEKNSSFRHNDLHLENIFITAGGKVRIIDFGLGFSSSIKNPEVNNSGSYLVPYGIYRGNPKMYDVHFFLNSLFNHKKHLDDSTRKFIEDVIPAKYLGVNGIHIYAARLKPRKDGSTLLNIPTYTRLFNHPYIKGSTFSGILKTIPKMSQKTTPIIIKKKNKTPSSESMSAKIRRATEAYKKSKQTTQKKRPGIVTKKATPPKATAKTPESDNETLANMKKRLTKTRAKPSTLGKVSPSFVKSFMKNMARPKTNLRNRNI